DWATLPLTPVSISSNITVLISSCAAKILLIASIMRDNSPPDAVLDKGLNGSPLLEDNINSIWSMPSIPKLSSTFISTEKRASGKYKSCSSFSIKEISDVAVSFLIAVMFSAFFNAKAVCSSIFFFDLCYLFVFFFSFYDFLSRLIVIYVLLFISLHTTYFLNNREYNIFFFLFIKKYFSFCFLLLPHQREYQSSVVRSGS